LFTRRGAGSPLDSRTSATVDALRCGQTNEREANEDMHRLMLEGE
jgi:hypothetical protein